MTEYFLVVSTVDRPLHVVIGIIAIPQLEVDIGEFGYALPFVASMHLSEFTWWIVWYEYRCIPISGRTVPLQSHNWMLAPFAVLLLSRSRHFQNSPLSGSFDPWY